MRLLYVTARFPFGPGEAFLIPEVQELARQGHEVKIVPAYPKGPVLHLDATPCLSNTLAPGVASPEVLIAAAAETLRRPVRVFGLLGRVIGTGRAKNRLKNLVAFPHGLWLARLARSWHADHLHAHWAGPSSTAGWIASELSGLPWSFTAHSTDILQNNLLADKLTSAQFCRFISRSGLARLAKLGHAVPEGKACIVYMGVPVPPPIASEPPDAPVLLCPANLIEEKGHRYLIEAAGLLRDRGVAFELWLAGHGPLEPALDAQVEAAGLGAHVRFLGQLSHGALMALYEERQVGVTVLASIPIADRSEGIPVSLLEAMSYGVPIVSTEQGGVPELLAGGAGLVVPPYDAE
ncbi:MAG: glycosyltransferase, partial [Candidatus Sericytochromatia bacterium]